MDDSNLDEKSINETTRSLDISDVKYNDDGVIDFYWPLDNKNAAVVMNNLVESLIPFIKLLLSNIVESGPKPNKNFCVSLNNK